MTRGTLQSSTAYIRQIVRDIADNKIGIPAFQRSFVWEPRQVKELFDSIKKGYPIGSVLLWNKKEKMARREFLSDKILEPVEGMNYVLDGRQRLTVFYGCISPQHNKDHRFSLCYNLKNDTFAFPNELKVSKDRDLLVPISTIFDTFSLLDKLQDISVKYKDDPNICLYQNRAKELNTILQEYQVVQIVLADCSLDEAYKVFSRINSKGTEISKAEMLQASSYEEGGILLADAIDNIRKDLELYNFESLTQDDILKCFFKFVDKDFFDQINDLESINLKPYVEVARNAICLSARFLYEKCYVLSAKLLPYKKQFIALTWYFRLHPDYEKANIKELRKWFFYTTIKKSFQNSSLSVVRKLFSDFEDFARDKNSHPIEYTEVALPEDFDFSMNWNNARVDFLLLSWIRHYLKYSPFLSKSYEPQCWHVGKGGPENYFIILNEDDKLYLRNIFDRQMHIPYYMLSSARKDLSNSSSQAFYNLKKFGLSEDLISDYHFNRKKFLDRRRISFIEFQKDLWNEVNN